MGDRYIEAAKDGNLDILREATRRDLNSPDDDGMTATSWAAYSGNLEALRLIVGRGGDVDKADYLGLTALHHAASRGHMGVVSYLVNWGCNVYALDNDLHSGMEVAAMHNRQEIVRFLDYDLGQRQSKNPRHAARQKEDAMKAAEQNIKRFQKLQDTAARKRDKEQKKRQKEMEHKLSHVQDADNAIGTAKQKMSFFKTLTMRGKKSATSKGDGLAFDASRFGTSKYSDFTGTAVNTARKGGIASKIHRKQVEAAFRVSDMDPSGQRTLRSVAPHQGFVGSSSEVMYVGSVHGSLGTGKRQPISADFFLKSNIYKARSESDLLDSGVASYNGDDYENGNSYDNDDDNTPGIFNRPEFGKLAFFQKNAFLGTLQSLEDENASPNGHANNDNGVGSEKRFSGDGEEGDRGSLLSEKSRDSSEISRHSQRCLTEAGQHMTAQMPWDQDDLDNLDDDDDDEYNENGTSKEMSAVNMFLWSCGQASYLNIFSQEKIDLPLLMRMTDTEMKELGIPFGPRKKLREAIEKRQTVLDAPPTAMKDSYL